MGHRSQMRAGFLGRLHADRSGNTLAIAAASLLPLMALIGGGVDVSRAYMAKTQLQSACDAGVLAGRRALSKSGTYGTAEKAKANKMFNFNFNEGALDVTNLTYDTDDNDDGEVTGTATATLPTLVMNVFNMDTVDLEVECMAELQIGNVDVMFVLDNTTSMACKPEDTSTGCTQYGVNDSRSKMYGLKEAVKDFHKTINTAVNDNRTRIRYGFVPYAMTVNVKGLLNDGDLPEDYITDQTRYQSRLAVFNTPEYEVDYTENLGSVEETYGSPTAISSSNCTKYGDNRYPTTGSNPSSTGTIPNPVTTKEYDYVSWKKTGKSGNTDVGTCKRRVSTTKTHYELVGYKFTTWRYQQTPIDTANFKEFSSVPVATNVSTARVATAGNYDPVLLAKMQAGTASNGVATQNVGTTSYTWNGCIEERSTIAETDFDPIPDEALDLDFDLVPTDDAETKWKPMWPNIEFSRTNYVSEDSTSSRSSVGANCPASMQLFETVTLSDNNNDIPTSLTNYLNTLAYSGYTYHDVGMIWGGRLTSPTGLFKDNVTLDADKINVSRHIVFMTDGILQPENNQYSAYGLEKLDSRVTGDPDDLDELYARHMARFVATCEAIKDQGTTIWVVAFGTSMTNELRNCASDGRAYYSSNTTALRNTFKFIAAQVADLRLGA